jgi:Lrp/AsnC family transcriptional regulator for asnA, asnC and gidA
MLGLSVSGPPEQVADELSHWEEAVYVVVVAGRFDLLVELVAHDRRHLLELMNRIRALGGVTSSETFLYLDLRKYDFGTA